MNSDHIVLSDTVRSAEIKVYAFFIDSVKSEVLTVESDKSLEEKFEDMDLSGRADVKAGLFRLEDYLAEASPFCKVCNDEVEAGGGEGECDRCGLSLGFCEEIFGVDLKTGEVVEELGLDIDGVVDLEDELTRDLYSVWEREVGVDDLGCLDRSKRIKRSDSQ